MAKVEFRVILISLLERLMYGKTRKLAQNQQSLCAFVYFNTIITCQPVARRCAEYPGRQTGRRASGLEMYMNVVGGDSTSRSMEKGVDRVTGRRMRIRIALFK